MPAQMSLSQMLAQASQQQSVSAQNPVGNLMQSSIMQSEAMSAVGQQEISQNRLPFSPETMNQANKLHEVSNRLEHIGHVNLARQLRDSIDQAATGNAPPAWQPVSPAGLLTAVRSGQIPRGAVLPSILRIIFAHQQVLLLVPLNQLTSKGTQHLLIRAFPCVMT